MRLEATSPSSAPLKDVSMIFWAWYASHSQDTWPIKVWFINTRIPISLLHGLFERIFGTEPSRSF